MRRNITRIMLSAALLAASGVPLMAQETEKPVADMLDVKFNADGTAEDVSPMKNAVETVGENMSTYYNDGFGFVVANFANTWGAGNSSGYRVDYEQNEDFKSKLADGHTLEVVLMADYPTGADVDEVKPFSSMERGGTGFLIKRSRGSVMTFLPNVSANGSSKWNWCTSSISPRQKIYYHFVGVWNQEEGKAYIYGNGKLMNTIATDKVFCFAADGSKWFCIGGDPGGSSVQAGWRGDVAVARVYSDPLTGEQAEALWEDAKGGVNSANTLVYRKGVEEARAYVEADGFIAYANDIAAFKAQLDEMDRLIDAGDFEALEAGQDSLAILRAALETSAAAYNAYRDEVNSTREYLDNNTDFEGEARNHLEDYLESDEAPGETYTNGGALYILGNMQLNVEQIKAETESVKQMLKNAIENSVKSGVEVTNLFTNADFTDGFKGWEGKAMTKAMKSSTTGFTAAECWAKNCDMHQTLTKRNNGVYVLAVNGAYRPYDDRYSTYYAAQVYLNGNSLYLPTAYETYIPLAEAKDGENCYITDTGKDDGVVDYEIFDGQGASTDLIGYAIHGCTGMANAAAAGRAQNYLVTLVNDSTLTLGVRNENTVPGQDWVGISNIHVTYYETLKDAEAYIDKTLECMAARAQGIINFLPSTGADYAQHPGCPQELKGKLEEAVKAIATSTTPEQKYALVQTFSTLFEQVLEARKAYVSMVDEAMVIYNIAQKLDEAKLLTPEEYNTAMDKYNTVLTIYENGSYTTEQARNLSIFKDSGFYPELVDGEYQISTNAQLLYFAEKATKGVKGKLLADIPNFTGAQMIDQFRGILNGNGHKVTLNIERTEDNAAFIASMEAGAEVHNLVIEGTVKTTKKYAASVAANTQENCRISQVSSSVDIVTETAGDGTHAGLVAVVGGYTRIENSLFSGSIKGTGTSDVGGLVGWSDKASKISNCLQIATFDLDTKGCNTIARNPGKSAAINTYFKNALGDIAGTQVTDEQLASGEICYLLNHGDTENPVWHQTIGTDPHPVLDATHQTVGKTKDGAFTNDKASFHTEEEPAEPKADLLDVVFDTDGTARDISPMQNEVILLGEAPTVAYNETYKRNVATFDNELSGSGKSAYKIDYENNQKMKDALTDGHSLEAIVMVRYEGTIKSAEMKPFSSMEAGGTGFLIGKKDKGSMLTFLPNVSTSGGNTWRWATSGVVPESGKYYHIIGVYDEANAKARVYLDGKLCNEIAAPGIFRLANSGCRWFAIGGDPGAKDAIQAAWNGDVVLARIYSKALTDEDVQAICKKLDEETPVEGISATETRAKDGIYTINGIRVQKTTKGLYIINGKKVMVK